METAGGEPEPRGGNQVTMSTSLPIPDRHAEGHSRLAVRFFLQTAAMLLIAIVITVMLSSVFGRPAEAVAFRFPPAFAVSTLLLAGGSVALHRAVTMVRRERQRPFRRWLRAGVACGVLFLGVQGYGLWTLLPAERAAGDASLGVTPFVLMLAGLHALHLTVATLFIAFVATRASVNRYDHEYYWGVSVCAWFWHGLGAAWLFVLAIFAVAL